MQQVIKLAQRRQHVVLGSPPATGKTSLLQLIKRQLRDSETVKKVLQIPLNTTLSVAIVKEKLAGIGITEFEDDLERIENTWLLLDDAQNWYGEVYVLAILEVFDQAVARRICGTCVYHHCNYVRSLHPGFTCSF